MSRTDFMNPVFQYRCCLSILSSTATASVIVENPHQPSAGQGWLPRRRPISTTDVPAATTGENDRRSDHHIRPRPLYLPYHRRDFRIGDSIASSHPMGCGDRLAKGAVRRRNGTVCGADSMNGVIRSVGGRAKKNDVGPTIHPAKSSIIDPLTQSINT
ncbi:hypothetical protein VTI74DRAFT_11595 [Chaetomium olivicolor]